MFSLISNLLGGLGMFLLGMTLMSDSLKNFAGDSLRTALLAFTRRPATAFFSGMTVTALIQSSSATTLMTIGFVSAGILPFAHSVGVLMGAALGTTSTGWMVSLIGLNVSVSAYALLFVGVGSAVRLLLKGKRGSHLGTAIAGFGLIFIGIGLLQKGMSGVTDAVDFAALPSGGFGARLLIVLIGIVLTSLVQSCSAVMATNLTALSVGALDFEQSAALAIGAGVGTTVTAGIAAIGASTAAKRSAMAQAIFSTSTGVLALVSLPLLLLLLAFLQRRFGLEEGPTSLAVFHSLFIAMGVVIFLPFLGPYSAWIERLLPERGDAMTRFLDKSTLPLPSVALEAVGRGLRECRSVLARAAADRIRGAATAGEAAKASEGVAGAIDSLRAYLSKIEVEPDDSRSEARRISDVHIMDHLQRLAGLVRSQDVHPGTPRIDPWENRLAFALDACVIPASDAPAAPLPSGTAMAPLALEISHWRRAQRKEILQAAAAGGEDADALLRDLHTIQWLDQVTYHFARIEHHLAFTGATDADALPEPLPPAISKS